MRNPEHFTEIKNEIKVFENSSYIHTYIFILVHLSDIFSKECHVI